VALPQEGHSPQNGRGIHRRPCRAGQGHIAFRQKIKPCGPQRVSEHRVWDSGQLPDQLFLSVLLRGHREPPRSTTTNPNALVCFLSLDGLTKTVAARYRKKKQTVIRKADLAPLNLLCWLGVGKYGG